MDGGQGEIGRMQLGIVIPRTLKKCTFSPMGSFTFMTIIFLIIVTLTMFLQLKQTSNV